MTMKKLSDTIPEPKLVNSLPIEALTQSWCRGSFSESTDHSSFEEIEVGATVHLPFDELELGDLTFCLTI